MRGFKFGWNVKFLVVQAIVLMTSGSLWAMVDCAPCALNYVRCPTCTDYCGSCQPSTRPCNTSSALISCINNCPADCRYLDWETLSGNAAVLTKCNAQYGDTDSSISYSCGYRCAEGYYGLPAISMTSCKTCPQNGTCTEGSDVSCNAGYYKKKTGGNLLLPIYSCNRCPYDYAAKRYGISVKGSTSITACYIPASTKFSDVTGSWEYSQKCNYSE